MACISLIYKMRAHRDRKKLNSSETVILAVKWRTKIKGKNKNAVVEGGI